MKPVRVGLVGCGHLGRYHGQKLHQMDEAQLIGVFDLNSEKVAEFSKGLIFA